MTAARRRDTHVIRQRCTWIIRMGLDRDDVQGESGSYSHIVVTLSHDFQLEVLEKLGRVEAKLDMIVGNGQPGRMKLAEDRLNILEHNDIKRNVYDRIVTAAIAFAVSSLIAMHDHFLPK